MWIIEFIERAIFSSCRRSSTHFDHPLREFFCLSENTLHINDLHIGCFEFLGGRLRGKRKKVFSPKSISIAQWFEDRVVNLHNCGGSQEGTIESLGS